MRARSVEEPRRSFSKSWGMVIESSFFQTPRSKADAEVRMRGFNDPPQCQCKVEQSRANMTEFIFPGGPRGWRQWWLELDSGERALRARIYGGAQSGGPDTTARSDARRPASSRR